MKKKALRWTLIVLEGKNHGILKGKNESLVVEIGTCFLNSRVNSPPRPPGSSPHWPSGGWWRSRVGGGKAYHWLRFSCCPVLIHPKLFIMAVCPSRHGNQERLKNSNRFKCLLYSPRCPALYHYLSYYFRSIRESIETPPAAKLSC